MPENNPLLNRDLLEKAYSSYTPEGVPVELPNVPFKAPNLLLPTVGGEPTPSALSAIENSVLSARKTDNGGKLTGGSIPRTLKESTSSRYNNYLPGYNNEDAYAQGQGIGNKVVNAVGKGLLLTGTTFLQSTIGLINGVGQSITDGRLASFYDNDLNRRLDELNKAAEDSMPNYYKDIEKNANWYSPSKLFTANFLFDGVIKNLGFAAGAALAGGVYAAGLRAIPLTSRLFSIGKAAETLAATEEGLLAANKVADTYGKVKSLSDKFLSSYNVLNPGGRAIVAGLATTGEASFEAYGNLNEFRNQKIEEYKDTHGGRSPFGSDLDEINSLSDSVGNTSFALNTALLTATNYIQFPKILGSSYSAEKGVINGLSKEISPLIKNEAGEFVKKVPTTRFGKVLSSVNKIRPYTFSTSESFEEGAQFAIGVGTKDYYNKKYSGVENSFFDSLSKSVSETLGTNEGMENILIGGLSGAWMLARGTFQERRDKGINTEKAIQAFNKFKLSDFTKETISSVNRGTVLQQQREEAIKQGEVLESKDLEADYIINYLTPRIKYGREDLITSDIADYKQLASTEEGFAQLQKEGKAQNTDTREKFLTRLSSLESSVKNVKSLYQSLSLRYGGIIDKDGNPVYSPEVMDQMIYAGTKVADYDQRILDLNSHLLLSGVNTLDILNDLNLGNSESFNKAIEDIQKLDILADKKEDLLQQLQDVSELSMRRQKFLKEYTDLKTSPQTFKDEEVPSTPSSVKIKTKDGEEDITVGEEYFLGKVVEYDKDGKEVYRFPKLTILGQNEDGTIRIKDNKGVRNISASELEDYKLGKVSDTLSNKKAKFFMENANSIFEFNFGKGKKQRGRLEYSSKDKVLNFVYKDKKGKIRRLEVTADQFVPKKGFTNARLSVVGQLSAAQKESLDKFTSETDDRTVEKRVSRLNIINTLFDELTNKHAASKKLISQKQNEVKNIIEELSDLEEQIKNAEFDARSKKALRFKSQGKKALEAAMRLSKMKDQLEQEIEALQSEVDELEIHAGYVADLAQNIDELPTDSKEFLEELRDQRDLLESTILETGKNINTLSSLIDKVQGALDKAVSYLKSVVDNFRSMYPKVPLALGQEWVDFLKDNPNFLKNRPYYKSDLKFVEDLVGQVEDLDITPNERSVKELKSELEVLQKALKETEEELKAKDAILARFEEVAEKFQKQKEEEKKLANNEKLRNEILRSGDTGIQTRENSNDYEPQSKKSDKAVVTSTKVASKSILPHHVRANKFGVNLPSFKNKDKIKGVLVTSKNEKELGLEGLTTFLKGDSDVDASKIITLVMVQEGKLVGENGEVLISPSVENAIFQVMPDPSLTWSKEFGGGSMFRKDTPQETADYYKKQYSEWVNNTLENPSLNEHEITPSFGIPQYVTYLDDKGNEKRDYNASISVVDANLISNSDLKETPVIFIPTTDTTVEKGSTLFNSPLGRVFLSVPNGYVKLNNRKLTPKEAVTIYDAINALVNDIFDSGDAQSDKAKRLQNWLKSVIYWGKPRNEKGYNSVFYKTAEDGSLELMVSGGGKTYPFTPSSIQANKSEIITLLEGMYNNVNSTMVSKSWKESYEQIISISPKGEIESKIWDNYQTYLLTNKELPLSTQMKPVKEGEFNREGVYFTITDTADNWIPPTPTTTKTLLPKAAPIQENITAPVFPKLKFLSVADLEPLDSELMLEVKKQENLLKSEYQKFEDLMNCLWKT